ncbi:response regulator [archaeon]|nr:MAG: response regulator [archaeon]
MNGDAVTTEDLEDSLNCICQSIQNMKNTNSFMLMTINRCIDYTKASNNMKLVPKYETIDLMETLELPMNCMKDIQSRINIVLKPIDADICMYIITDKQWLQENVLCLLSNAVKYSLEGTVTITVTKVMGPGKKSNSNSSQGGSQSSTKSGIKNVIYKMQRNKACNKDLLKLESYRSGQAVGGGGYSHAKLEAYDEKDGVGGDLEGIDNASDGGSSRRNKASKTSLLSLHSVDEGDEEIDTSTATDPNAAQVSSIGPSKHMVDTIIPPETTKKSSNTDSLDTIPSQPIDLFDDFSEDVSRAEYLKIEIEDHGIGLSEDVMGSLFSPFRQAQRLAGGTGLGLFSLAKRIEALEGFCGVKKRRDGLEGSLFWFSIPYRPDTILSNALNQANQNALPPRGLSIPRLMTLKKASIHRLSTQFSNTHLNNGSGDSLHGQDKWKGKHATIAQHGNAQINTSTLSSSANAANKFGLDISVSASASHSNLSCKSNSNGAPKLENLDILIVDDSPTILKTTTMMLKRAKHNVTTAINGAEAIKKVMERLNSSSSMFDVILMDLQMPVMDGLEATRRIRHLECTSNTPSGFTSSSKGLLGKASSITAMFKSDSKITPSQSAHINIIGVSANSDPETSAAAYKMGVDAFIAKPFTLDAFNATYEQVIALQNTTL